MTENRIPESRPDTFQAVVQRLLEDTVNNNLAWSCETKSYGDVYTVTYGLLSFTLDMNDELGYGFSPELYADGYRLDKVLDSELFEELQTAVKVNHECFLVAQFNYDPAKEVLEFL